ncbi:hypothetical protein O6H91_20G025500 [Diphasiastrum complanatum]|uniref:Uncharacterized protein n=2 Tax=Diphasiastrum complanatum TaxID=34168 RepID=A0ACC2ANH9_DIPCM|nr:hypothetical protein O6H91_20G025000 [Diphasiastrum complanatum]KAJ7519163.1 hypothetical protein O6H91_20G025500 [Diphasiastrum complanatum]
MPTLPGISSAAASVAVQLPSQAEAEPQHCPTVYSLSRPFLRQDASLSLGLQTWRGLRPIGKKPSQLLRQTTAATHFVARNNDRGRSEQLGLRALFTGIVEELGNVREVRLTEDGGYEMRIDANIVIEDVKLGDSISVNGTCLTVTHFDSKGFTVGLSPETLRRTSLGEAFAGSPVNLERSLQPVSRMGGHFVQGHVDGTGTIVSFNPEGDSLWVKIKTSADLLRYIVPKGYISVDGTSLTVVGVYDEESSFTFMLVAYTQQKIVIPVKKLGSKVNLEVDIVGKYVERLLKGYSKA